jgi:hypothetical protein
MLNDDVIVSCTVTFEYYWRVLLHVYMLNTVMLEDDVIFPLFIVAMLYN